MCMELVKQQRMVMVVVVGEVEPAEGSASRRPIPQGDSHPVIPDYATSRAGVGYGSIVAHVSDQQPTVWGLITDRTDRGEELSSLLVCHVLPTATIPDHNPRDAPGPSCCRAQHDCAHPDQSAPRALVATCGCDYVHVRASCLVNSKSHLLTAGKVA